MHRRPDDFERVRLSATMASQRLLVLDFVRRYIDQWAESPSHGEIAVALEIDRTKVRRAIRSLEADGLLVRTPGPRGLALPTAEAEAVRKLRALGWTVNHDLSLAVKATLLPPAALDYTGPCEEGPMHGETPDARSQNS